METIISNMYPNKFSSLSDCCRTSLYDLMVCLGAFCFVAKFWWVTITS